ncbi:MAG: hypothetical protein Q7T49_00080 [bacterium]|nr:hypothetical protein [bacterium]
MKNNFHQFIKQLKTVRLNRAAKRAGWEYLVKELGLKPATIWRWPVYTYAIFSLILTIALGAGISQAAEGAIPGDILYPLKTKVREPVERILVSKTPTAQASFETKLVERRLNEAEQVLQKNVEKNTETEQKVRDDLKLKIAEQTARAISEQDQDKEGDNLKIIFKEHEQLIRDLEQKTEHEYRQDGKGVRKSEDERHNKSEDKERD